MILLAFKNNKSKLQPINKASFGPPELGEIIIVRTNQGFGQV